MYQKFHMSIKCLIFASRDQYMYGLSYERQGNISYCLRGDIIFVTSKHSERGTKYDVVTRAIKLILPSLECDNLHAYHIL